MGNVTIRLFKDEDSARNAAGTAHGAGKKVTVAGPTDMIKIKGNEPDLVEWRSGPDFDWYIVMETRDDMEFLPPSD